MATIHVKEINQGVFEVKIQAIRTTEHEVTVDSTYAKKLTNGQLSTAELVNKSFEFLLERESNTSILRRFNLSLIGQYFPEYESIFNH